MEIKSLTVELEPQVIEVSSENEVEELTWNAELTVDCGRCPP